MRLLRRSDTGEFSLTQFCDEPIPPYAILSHTWGADTEEITFDDLANSTGNDKPGYEKIRFCGKQAAADDLEYFWIDTCCIKKSSDAELSESINSMFRWYQNAAKCYVYISDVSIDQDDARRSRPRWEEAFRKSRWFTRGWTLQELIAPPSVEFFCSNGQRLGDKKELAQEIHEITGIPLAALRGASLSEFDVNERMSWAQHRKTKRPEDMAYSLLGIFGIHIPLIYGEGKSNALNRLQWELDRRAKEQSDLSRNPILNPHPVKRNYRKVVVVIISWECDRLELTVQNISKVFRELYHYEVRETLLTLEEQHRGDPNWPWPDTSDIEETDLQIVYYLGSTRQVSDQCGFMDIQAFPFQKLPQCDDQISSHYNWLQATIGIPQLTSDVLIVLDCYTGGFSRDGAEEPISILDGGDPWTRYGVMGAGYAESSCGPGGFSRRFMSILEDLAHSGELVNCGSVMRKLMERRRLEDDMEPVFKGNHGMNSIILTPILDRIW